MFNLYKIVVGLLLLPAFALAQISGSNSLVHVQSASTMKEKRLDFRTDVQFFTKVGDFLGQTKPANFSAVNFWDIQSNASFSYGIARNFDASVNIQLYQDVHKDKEYDAPADLFFDFKAGSFGLSNNRFNLGTLFSLRLPTGETHNYPFQAYSAGAVEFGVTGLASFFNDPFLPHRDLSFHLNTGWYYHNDAGKTLVSQAFTTSTGVDSTRELTAGNNSSAFRYGLGFSYPTELFDLNLEIWGNKFISKPDSLALSREDYTYFTPSILFKPKWWVNFNFALDLRVSANTDETDPRYTFSGGNLDLPNYASWFMHMGMNFVLNPGDSRIRGGISERADLKKKVDFYERLLKEREKTRSIEEELRRLKREREQAEKELEELRQLLEEEG